MLPPTLRQPDPALREIIEQAYAVFADYPLSGALQVCHCGVCMSLETERELRRTPLRRIPARLLAEYTNSAHAWDDVVAREMRHFLPRYLELIATGEAPCAIGLEICLRRLQQAGWRERWPTAEREVLGRYFKRLMAFNLTRQELVRWPVGWRLEFDIAAVLTLVATAGGDIDQVLGAWNAAPDPAAAIHMAALRQKLATEHGRPCLRSSFLPRRSEAARAVGAFLARAEVSDRIERAFFVTPDERLQQILSDGAAYRP